MHMKGLFVSGPGRGNDFALQTATSRASLYGRIMRVALQQRKDPRPFIRCLRFRGRGKHRRRRRENFCTWPSNLCCVVRFSGDINAWHQPGVFAWRWREEGALVWLWLHLRSEGIDAPTRERAAPLPSLISTRYPSGSFCTLLFMYDGLSPAPFRHNARRDVSCIFKLSFPFSYSRAFSIYGIRTASCCYVCTYVI